MRLILVLSLFLVSGFAGAGEHWERFRGPNGSGIADDKDVPVQFSATENVRWKTPIPGVGNGSPIVWSDRVFVHSASEDGKQRMLLCLDAKTGEILWNKTIPGIKVKVRYDSTLANSTPVTDGEAVYLAVWDGKNVFMKAYDFQGNGLWTRDLGPFISQHGPGASPILYKDKILFANDMDKEDPATKAPVSRPSILLALNKKTGATVWEAPREAVRACYSGLFFHPNAKGEQELIVVSTSAVTGYNPDTGAKNWEFGPWQSNTVRMPLRTVASATLVDDVLVASSGDGGGDRYAAGITVGGPDKETSHRLWENSKDFPYVPCPVTRGSHLYFVNDSGFAGCYEPKTGTRLWQERQPDAKFTASPVLIDGKIYAGSEQGDVFVFAAEPKFQLLARNKLGERIRATPAVANNCLYIRGQDHLFCIGKP